MNTFRAANLAVKFGLELAAVAAFAVWGASVGSGALAVLLAVIAPLLAIGLWSTFAAPRSTRRLPTRVRIPFELAIFALATLALIASGNGTFGIVFAVTAVINAVCLTWLEQWER